MFFKLHWIKFVVALIISVILTSVFIFMTVGLREYQTMDIVSKQRTAASFPFMFYIYILNAIFFAATLSLMSLITQGGMISSLTRTVKDAVKGDQIGVRWSDVIGMDEVKKEAMEVVQLIRDRVALEKKGAQIFRGVLLLGPPGCGKTYLVKALATETNLPFLSMSGSEFTEIFVGVGAARIRKLFKRARQLSDLHGGCIIFIDEIDALGLMRTRDLGGGGQTERNTTLNQLLVEMDGLRGRDDNIVVFGATNMTEGVLDVAFLRPGRFDRKIYIHLPDIEDRKKILEFYLSKVSYDQQTANLERLARIAVGFSPAEIANLVREAIIISQRNKKPSLTIEDINAARDRVLLGLKRKFRMGIDEKTRAAFYEAGRILVTYLYIPTKDVFKASILPHGRSSISVFMTSEMEDILSRDKNTLISEIKVSLSGYCAEKIKFGNTSDTAASHLEYANEIAHNMAWRWGMGKSGHIGNFDTGRTSLIIEQDLNKDVEEVMDSCLREVNNLLRQDWAIVENLVKVLLENDELDYDQIDAIFKQFGKHRPDKSEMKSEDKPLIDTGIGWADVIGMEETKQEAKEVVELIKDRARLQKVGGKIIKGLLMFGPPGCGKTYLAGAMAQEFKLPFLYKSGSEFVEMYVGVGAMRVRRMFMEAKELADVHGGCIFFIDEIDALGAKRGMDMGSGGQSEYNQTLNQLLVEMDGLRSKDKDYNIVVIGATNMKEGFFDAALLRPGRFDRKIYVYLPNLEDRQKLFEYYLSKVSYDKNSIDLGKLARISVGNSPADIANIIHEAAILAVRNKKDLLTLQEISEAMERIQLGLRQRINLSQKEKEVTAYHEAGHAIITYLLEEKRDVFKVSIIPRKSTAGVSWSHETEETLSFDQKEALARIKCSLGGYVAEKIKYGYSGAGVSQDFANIMRIAHSMVYEWGMGESGFLGNFNSIDRVSGDIRTKLDSDVQKIIRSAMSEVEQILTREQQLLDTFAAELLKMQELDYDQMEAIFKSFGKARLARINRFCGENFEQGKYNLRWILGMSGMCAGIIFLDKA
jgi:cell division protease FtsH